MRRTSTIKLAKGTDRPKPTVNAMANKERPKKMMMSDAVMKMKDNNSIKKMMKLK